MKKVGQLAASLLFVAAASISQAQEFYTFESGPSGDGFTWPAIIPDGDSLYPFDGNYEGLAGFDNETNNPIMFSSSYFATGSASRIDGPALWGNPRSGNPLGEPYLYIDLSWLFIEGEFGLEEEVTSVGFDFAWATSAGSPASPPPIDTILVVVSDYNGNSEGYSVPLTETFPHGIGGSGVGHQGRVILDTFGSVENIYEIEIYLEDGAPPGSMAEFAIDNLEFSTDGSVSGPSEVFPVDFDDSPSNDYGTNVLKGTGNFGFEQYVRNGGDQPTSFTITWTGSSPAIFDPNPSAGVNVPIGPGETIYGAASWRVDTDTALSGTYSGSFLIENDNDPSDPDDTVTLINLEVYDPPLLSDNTAAIINPASANQISVSNAANEPHAGATRASVSVKSIVFTDSRFSLTGLAIDDQLNAAQTWTGTVAFDPTGVPAGTYTASLRVGLEMTSPTSGFLNRDQPVPDRVWTVQFTVGATNQGVANVITGQNLGTSGLQITSGSTGLTLLDGTSASNQTLTASFDNAPPANGGTKFLNQAFDLEFSIASSLYVMQIGYQDADLPIGFTEEELQIYTYNTGTSQWVPAIDLNTNGGTSPAGASPYIGSYADYLASLGGGTLDNTDLGAFGIDPAGNQAWAVLDHASKFRLGTAPIGSSPPEIISITRDALTNTNTITYQSIAGETFGVSVSDNLTTNLPLPATGVGDDTVKIYTHQPAAGSKRQFYQLIRN